MAQTIRNRLDAAKKLLGKHNQQQLIISADQLESEAKRALLEEIEGLDLPLIDRLVEQYIRTEPKFELPADIQPPPVYPVVPTAELEQKYQLALQRGERLIAEHRLAAFIVAGGQGTRLNFNGPKGNVTATPLRNKTLFRLFAEGIVAVQRRYNCVVPWYIMTSTTNYEDTIRSFEQNGYFGLDPENVIHFRQGQMPSFDKDGKILLAEHGHIAVSPDGHGGSLRALYHSGALEDMERRSIEYISYFQVDNPLVYPIDPLFIGLHALDGAEMSSKAVIKTGPDEKVGVFALADGKVQVIEYSDLPEDLAQKKLDNGRLALEYGSIAIHMINCSFVRKLNEHGFSLPWHRALKKVLYIDESGTRIEPAEPNAIKLETFVFDALPLADKSIILEIERAEQFAPIKNASGVDSLQTSQQLQVDRAARWMAQAGIEVPRKPDGSVDVIIEISPLFAIDPHELRHKRRQLRRLEPGDIVYLG